MKLKNLFAAIVAGVALLVSCDVEEADYGKASIAINPTEVSFTADEGSASIDVRSTRDWKVSGVPDWIALSQETGVASTDAQTITLSVNPNTGYDRSAVLVFNIGFDKTTLTVNQAGPNGVIDNGAGTLEKPYTVAGVIEYTRSLGSDVESPAVVFFKGIISSVVTTYEDSGTYGNATFYLVDNEGDTESFYVFQTYYLGNRQWKSGDVDVKAGDEVIVCGKVVNYKGNTPETVGKGGSFVYSLNGVSDGGEPAPEGTAKGSGTLEDPYNPQGAADFTKTLGKDVESASAIYIKGKISGVSTSYADSGTYGNATFYMVDAEDGTGEFYVYQTYYLGNRKWKAGDIDVKEGDEVIVCGKVVYFRGTTPETVGKGGSYVYSLNGVTDGGSTGGDATPKGTGTLEDPFNPAGAAAAAATLTYTDKDNYQTAGPYYIKGKISNVGTTFAASGNYGNASFTIVDADDETGTFEVFQTYYLGNRQWKTGDTEVKVGDIVIVYGPIMNYKGNTPETVGKGSSYIYSLNGVTGESDPTTGDATAKGTGTLEDPFNPAGAAAVAATLTYTDKNTYDTAGPYYIKGKISNVSTTFEASGNYGNANFTIVDADDETGTFEVFQTYYVGNRQWQAGDIDVKVGDVVIVYGPIMNYKGNTPETVGKGASYIYSLNGVTDAGTGGGDDPTGGGGTTAEEAKGDGTEASPYNPKAASDVASALASGDKTATDVYVAGVISSIKYTFNASFGTATFNISEDGGTTGTQFQCYSVYYIGNRAWVDGDKQVVVGASVVICGKLTNYQGTPETASKEAYIFSMEIPGDTPGGDNPGGDNPGGDNPGGDNPGGGDTTSITWTQAQLAAAACNGATVTMNDVVSFTNSSDYGTTTVTELRIYKSKTFTVKAASGYKITGITITCTANGTTKQGPGCFGAGAPSGYSYDGNTGTWSGSASSVAFTATDNQVRIKTLIVEYAAE